MPTRNQLAFGFARRDHSFALANRDDLVDLYMSEFLYYLRGRPLHFDDVYYLGLSQTEVKAQIILRHDAGAAVYFIHLPMLACRHIGPCTDGSPIALGSEQFDLDPVLQIPADVVQQ